MGGQRARVADVDQAGEQLQRVEEAGAGLAPAGQAEGQQSRGAARQVLACQRMLRMVLQAGIGHPRHPRMGLQVARHRQGVGADALHAQRQGLDALQDQERIERRERRAGIAQRHHPRAADVGRRAQRLGVDHAVVAHVRLAQAREARLVRGPREPPGIDDRPAEAVAMPAQVLGQRMHHDVGAEVEGPQQVRRRHGVVNDQRHAVSMGDLGHRGDVGDVAQRIADGFDEHRLGARVDQAGERVRLAVVGKARVDAELRQRVREQVVGPAVQGAGRDDVVAGLGDGLDGVGDRRLSRRQCQRADAALQRRHALLEHVRGRIHDPRVDVARHLQVEQVGAMLGAVEGVGHGLVDRHRHRVRGRVGRIAGMHGQRLGLPGLIGHARAPTSEARQ